MSNGAWNIESAFLSHCGTAPAERRRAVLRVAGVLPDLLRDAHVPPFSERHDTPEWLISQLVGPNSNSGDEEDFIRSDLTVAIRPSVSRDDRRGILVVYQRRCGPEGNLLSDRRATTYIPDVKTLENLDAARRAVPVSPMDIAQLYGTDPLILRLSAFGGNYRLAGVDQGMIAAIARPAVANAIRSL